MGALLCHRRLKKYWKKVRSRTDEIECLKILFVGPKGADGKAIRKLIDYFSSKDPHFVIEMRPNKRIQANRMGKN